MSTILRFFPVVTWGRTYDRTQFSSDLVAAVIVTIMLVPQSLAYALLAGLPPETGLYASILPLVAYTLFGTSRTLAVGPVAVVSLMTAAAISGVVATGRIDAVSAAITLAFLSGLILLAMGLFRLGFLANFLSHPVIAGFITASGILIAAGQLKHILGVKAEGDTLPELAISLARHAGQINPFAIAIGLSSVLFLVWVRKGFKPLLVRMGLGPRLADMIAKAGPVGAITVTTLAAWWFDLGASGVKLVGAVPPGLPGLSLPVLSPDLVSALFLPALLISVIGFVESVSVAETLAAKRRQRIEPDQELVALGASNLASSFSGGFPVTGGFARSVVNFDAGAATPAAGALTAIGLAAATLWLTPLLAFLPQATLSATIIVAVLSLVDLSVLKRSYDYSMADFLAVSTTILVTLGFGVESGVTAGVVLSLLIHLYKSSRPHMAVVGRVSGTEHFRNVERHDVETVPEILSLRIDESLYFANARQMEDTIMAMVASHPQVCHVILMASAINEIDLSALESLEVINSRLADRGVTLHLSEVKGPVMDRLERSQFLSSLSGSVFLTQHKAVQALRPARLTAAGPVVPAETV